MISDEERQRRQEADSYAWGSVRLEGCIPSPECDAISARFVNGEITTEEAIFLIKKHYGLEGK